MNSNSLHKRGLEDSTQAYLYRALAKPKRTHSLHQVVIILKDNSFDCYIDDIIAKGDDLEEIEHLTTGY